MKVECSKSRLRDALIKADKVTGKNATLPVLSCIVLEAKGSSLIIQSTNLELGLKITLPIKVHKEGMVAVPGTLLVSYISSLGGDSPVTLESVDGTLLVTDDTNETKIKTLSHEDFPPISKLESEKSFTIPSEEFITGLKSVWYSASVSSMKPELSSVYMYPETNYVVFVATDSFRLAEKKVRIEGEMNFEHILIPFRNVTELIRIFDKVDGPIKVVFDNNQASFSNDSLYVLSRIIDGTFPDYKQIIPKTSTTEAVVLKNDLQSALKVSNIFSDNFNQVTFNVNPVDSVFEIHSKNIDKGENRNVVDASLEGEVIESRFNQKYITDCFSSINSDSVVLKFHGSGKPMIITGVRDSSFMYLVMPMNK